MSNNFLKPIAISVFMLFAAVAMADSFDDVVGAIKTSNSREISRFLNSSVELTINNNEGVYSKQQAEMMLKNFFAQHTFKSIAIQHRGVSPDAKYAIANYETSQGKYRVYIFMKDGGNGLLVHELRFEKE
ncbi:MAG: DUF4783 domain-containing protein [Bacteroidota bacterium]